MRTSLRPALRVPSEAQSLEEAREHVRESLKGIACRLAEMGVPSPALDGKILRPLAAYLTVPVDRRAELGDRFWAGALAVEMVHEASLLHDDILDEAPERRGKPTMAAAVGVGPALVLGDHLLTGAYRAAAAAESPEFLRVFIRSVERTVAGEIAQERSQGTILHEPDYRGIINGKSGELFRSALSLAPSLLSVGSVGRAGNLGARLGQLYQMVDDFLDYCPHAERGKQPLRDYSQGKWTWPLGLIGATDFRTSQTEILSRLFRSDDPGLPAPMIQGAEAMAADFEALLQDLASEGLETTELTGMLRAWADLMRHAGRIEVEAHQGHPRFTLQLGAEAPEPAPSDRTRVQVREDLRTRSAALDLPGHRLAYFGRHARSFRFASRLFPRPRLEQVAGVYAFCRFTDDLVDEAGGETAVVLRARLDEWLSMAREAYDGEATGSMLLDDVMADMRASGVPFHYVENLVEGVRMDLEPREYGSLEELREYSYRVASVVGGWLTELFGIQDPWMLGRAFALGHAMQLTNILRDVGEDLRMGRLYLPQDRMQRHGIDRELLEAKASAGSPAFSGYRALMEELMDKADQDYQKAFQAIPSLPLVFRGPVAVAASVYQGIHREIRRNQYDNLNRRAKTSLLRKVLLAIRGLARLRSVAAARPAEDQESSSLLSVRRRKEGQEAAA